MPGGKAESTMPRDTARSPSLAGILWNGGAWVDSIFDDTPSGRRRLVLALYGLAGPLFLGSLVILGAGRGGPGPIGAIAALMISGALWVLLRRRPRTFDWILTVAVLPTVCCGIAYATSGVTGAAYLALVGAPLACAAALFERPVMLAAIATVIPTAVVSLSFQVGAGAAAVSTLLLAPAAAMTGWVIHSSADQIRSTRRRLQELARRDRALLRSLPDVLVRADRLGRVLDVHVPSTGGLPLPREDLIGRNVLDLVPGGVAGSMRDALARALEVEEHQTVEYASPGPKDERFYEVTLLRSGPDEVTLIRRDMTERRRAEEERRFSAALLGHMQEAVIAVDTELKVTSWTGGAERIYGWTEAEMLGKPIAPFLQPDLAEVDAAAYAAHLSRRGPDRAVVRQRRKDGAQITVDSSVGALHDADGRPKGYLAVCRDVTVQRAAERGLKESEAWLRAYFQSPAVGIAITSPGKGWMQVNDRVCSMLGYSREELTGTTWQELTHPDDLAANLALFDRLLAGEIDSYSLDKRFIRKDGTILWTLVSASCVRGEDRGVRYVVSIFMDIDRRKEAEGALLESERWLRMSQDIARIGHYVYDLQQDRWTSSPALDAIFGIDASFPRKAADWSWIIHPEDREEMRTYLGELLGSGTRFDREYRVVNQSTGATCWVHGLGELERAPGGEPVRLVGTIQDVTARRTAEAERNALQAKLSLAARLSAMGTLVAGVAHEINNPLAAQLAGQGYALDVARDARRRLDEKPGPAPEAQARLLDTMIETLEDAQEAGQRIAQIVKDLSAFGRPNPARVRVRLAAVIEQAVSWLPATTLQAATVEVEDLGAPDVLASGSQVEQVVINLVTNAAKAVPEGRKGRIVIRLGTSGTGMARLEVIDDGVGIPAALMDRIFEPFFTTRPVGDRRGIGIGLAISHSIVEAHGGALTVTSEVGKGSTFRVDLPAANDPA